MKHDNRKRNRLIACLMCAVLVGSAFYCMPSVFATTVESELTDTKAYREWKATKPENGNFEAGYAGKEVYGWHLTAMESNGAKTVNSDTSPNRIETFLSAYKFKTVEDSGNKMASLSKDGAGYVGVTSQETEVNGSETYHISFDYILKELSGTGAYYGVRLLVEELNENKETILVNNREVCQYYGEEGEVADEDIPTIGTNIEANIEFQTSEETKYVIVYLWFGAAVARKAIVYFDNVTLEAYEDLNGTFDNVTYIGDGKREDGIAGPAGWINAGCNNAGAYGESYVGYSQNYKAIVEQDENGNNVLCYSYDTVSGVPGYSLIQSPYIKLEGGEQFSIQYDRKIQYNSGSNTLATKLVFWYYNANKEYISAVKDNGTGCEQSMDMTVNNDWKTLYSTVQTAPENTAYVKIGFFAGQTNKYEASFKLYYDNVIFKTYDTDLAMNWTEETCKENGIPRADNYTSRYDIRTVNEGAEHNEALQLYVAEYIQTGVVYYSKPISVVPGESYKTSFDLKIENNFDYYYTIDGVNYFTDETTYIDADGVEQATTKTQLYGASYVLRHKDSNGNVISQYTDGVSPDRTCVNMVKNNQDWTSYEYTFTAPQNASTVEVGLVIGGYTQKMCPDLMYTWDNIVLMKTKDYNEYKSNTDLLFKLTEGGNADLDEADTVDVLDLVMMKKYAADAALITDAILEKADMNVNTLINNADIELLHWKLLGITTEDQAALVQGYDFYQ